MDAPTKRQRAPDPRPIQPAALIVGGPFLSLAVYLLFLVCVGVNKMNDEIASLLGMLAAFGLPFIGGLLVREHVVIRIWLGLLLGLCGAIFFLCGGFPIWLKYGPGWMD